MGQEEVLKVLFENYPNEMTSREIQKVLGIGFSSVTTSLHKLRKDGFVKGRWGRKDNYRTIYYSLPKHVYEELKKEYRKNGNTKNN